jgi:hypothetical protein
LDQHSATFRQSKQQFRKLFHNWLAYQEPRRSWEIADPRASVADSVPDNWQGVFDFRHASRAGALQTYYGDTTTPKLEPLVGCRSANKPGAWINYKPIGHNAAVEPTISPDGRTIEWNGLWTNTSLRYDESAAGLNKLITINRLGGPTTFEFTARIPDGYTLQIANGAGRLLDGRGAEVMRLPPPWAQDSSPIEGDNRIRVTLEDGGERIINGIIYRVIRLVLNPDDVANATLPIRCDPQTTISGPTAIETTYLRSNNVNRNHGADNGNQFWSVYMGHSGGTNIYHSVFRLTDPTNDIPAGTITEVTLDWWQQHLAGWETKGSQTYDIFAIKDDNDSAGWGLGNKNSTDASAGESCWSQPRRFQTNWQSVGCSGIGTDVDATADFSFTPPVPNDGTNENHQHAMGATAITTVTNWRDGVRASGWMIKIQNETGAGFRGTRFYSPAQVSFPLTLVIDYTAGPSGLALIPMIGRR